MGTTQTATPRNASPCGMEASKMRGLVQGNAGSCGTELRGLTQGRWGGLP